MQQPIEHDHDDQTQQVQAGAMVVHSGQDDAVLGSVERVITDPQTGALTELHLRHGRADYLLKLPAEFVSVEGPDRVRIRADVRLEALEQLAIENDRTPPTGTNIKDAGLTAPSPTPEEIVGNTPGMPSTWDGPSTG